MNIKNIVTGTLIGFSAIISPLESTAQSVPSTESTSSTTSNVRYHQKPCISGAKALTMCIQYADAMSKADKYKTLIEDARRNGEDPSEYQRKMEECLRAGKQLVTESLKYRVKPGFE